MSLKDRLNLVLGGEDGNPDVVLVTPEEHAIVLADGEIATADVVVAEAQQEITQNTVDIEQLEERVEDLESDVAGLEAMLSAQVPWNPELAKEKYERARKIAIRTFGENDAISLKGAEAFGDVSTAEMELLTGVEALKGSASSMWEGVKKFFINLYNSVITFFTGIFNSLRGLEKKADAMITKINSLSDDKIKEKIKLGKWNIFVGVGGGDGAKSVSEKTSNFKNALESVGKGLASQTTKDLSNAIHAGNVTLYSALKDKKSTQNENTETITARIAGVHFSITLPKTSPQDVTAALKASTISFKTSKEGIKTEGEVGDKLSKSDLIALTNKTKKDASDARIAKFDQAALKTARDKAIAKVNASGNDKEETNKEIAGIRAGNQAALKFATVVTSFLTKSIAANQAYIAAHY